MNTIRKQWSALENAARYGLKTPENGDWAVMTAEVPASKEHGGDIVRVKGMAVPLGVPLQAQHMKARPDGRPATLGAVVDVVEKGIDYEGKETPAKLAMWEWADKEYDFAREYKALWPKFMNKVSVGVLFSSDDAKPIKGYGYDIQKCECFELSIVTFGANPAAQALRTIKEALGDHLDIPSLADLDTVQRFAGELNTTLESFLGAFEAKHINQINKLIERFDNLECTVAAKLEKIAPQAGSREDEQGEDEGLLERLIEALRKA